MVSETRGLLVTVNSSDLDSLKPWHREHMASFGVSAYLAYGLDHVAKY